MSPTKRLIALTVAPLLLFVACSKKEDDSVAMSGTSATTTETTGTTIAPATTAAKQRSTTSTVDTSDDEELAKDALLEISDLPAGEWSASEIESSAGEKSEGSADFTKVESCKELVDDQRAIEAESSGRASVRFSQGMAEEIQIGSDVELWPSVDTVRQIGKIVDDPGFQRCMTDMFESQASGSGGLETSTGVRVSSFNVGVDADDVGVEFISGVTVRFTLDMGGLGNGGEGSVRLVFIGAGRGLATVSLMATEVPGMTAPVDPQSIDLTKTVEAAAEKLVKVLEDR